ncbi:putative phage tail protein [Komagataeibacter medellinensis]|nr:putative phage tail protein [Komagataeibacter medellinensis]
MSRTPEQVLTEHLAALCPDGWAWPQEPDSNLAGLLYPFSALVAQAEADMEALKPEINPGTSTLLLADYESVLGPDPCGRDTLATTTALRQALAYQRWTAQGGCSVPFFTRMAQALGVEIEIEEPWPAECGVAICGDAVCSGGDVLYDWIVHVKAGAANLEADAAICGLAVCGMSICGSVVVPAIADEAQALYCPMVRNKPADTHLYIMDQELN